MHCPLSVSRLCRFGLSTHWIWCRRPSAKIMNPIRVIKHFLFLLPKYDFYDQCFFYFPHDCWPRFECIIIRTTHYPGGTELKTKCWCEHIAHLILLVAWSVGTSNSSRCCAASYKLSSTGLVRVSQFWSPFAEDITVSNVPILKGTVTRRAYHDEPQAM